MCVSTQQLHTVCEEEEREKEKEMGGGGGGGGRDIERGRRGRETEIFIKCIQNKV